MRKLNFITLASLATLLTSVSAFAEEAAGAAAHGQGIGALGPALAISLAALGGALGQGRATAGALDGIARNPAAYNKLFVPMILGLVLIESLVIYALVIAFAKY